MAIVKMRNKRNGVTYVYDSTSYWDKEKKQPRNKRVCIGKLDSKTGEIVYNNYYRQKQEQQNMKQMGSANVLKYKRQFYGATYLFDAIAKKFGIDEDLKRCFPDSYKQILSMAYYLILEDHSPMRRFERWAHTHAHPFGDKIPSQRISELFAGITEEKKQRFFSLQSAKRLEREYLLYDTTSISSYSHTIKQVKYGYNKDHDPLAQINLALLMREESGLPVSYRKLPGNISDVSTINHLIKQMQFLNIKKVKLVMDRGFYSKDNVDALYNQHYKFLIGVKSSLTFVKEKLNMVRDSMVTHRYYYAPYALYCQSFSTTWNHTYVKKRSGEVLRSPRRLYLHLYYNEQRATDEKLQFHKLLDQLEDELRNGNTNHRHEAMYKRYFQTKHTPLQGIKVSYNDEAIKEKEKNLGYFALISNNIKEAHKAIEIYRNRDVIEKAYDDLKNRLNLRRTLVSSEESLEGKLFVQFIALMIISYIKKQMDKHKLFKKYTLLELLDELDIIERFIQPGGKTIIGEVTNKQKNLYEMMGIDPVA
jgi:transposase